MTDGKSRKPIVTITSKDLRWDYFNGEGKGGQNRNKVAACVRVFHDPSGAMGVAQDERKQGQNKQLAFKRLCANKKFITWLKLETMKKTGMLEQVEAEVDRQMNNVLVEVKDENGRWVKLNE